MARRLSTTTARRQAKPQPLRGMVAGVIELAPAPSGRLGAQGGYSVRLTTGERVTATLAAGVSADLARECLRDGRLVVLVPTADGPLIAGALQTHPHPHTDARGTMTLSAERLRLRAGRSLTLEIPGGRLELERGGALRLEGDKLVIDAAALVRILSARVEVP